MTAGNFPFTILNTSQFDWIRRVPSPEVAPVACMVVRFGAGTRAGKPGVGRPGSPGVGKGKGPGVGHGPPKIVLHSGAGQC